MTSKVICINSSTADIPMTTAQFVQKACEFKSRVTIAIDDKKAINGKSFMGMLSLNLQKGMEFQLISEGCDELQAVETLSSMMTQLSA